MLRFDPQIQQYNQVFYNPTIKQWFPTRILCNIVSGFMAACPCGVWRHELIFSLYMSTIFIRYILNKLVCMFDWMENTFSLLCKHLLKVTIDIYYELIISVFIFYFYLSNIF